MFGVDSSELFIVAVLALIFIGPKELPATMRTVGRLVGKVRAHARHFTAGIENIMREAELEEMEKRWREENERIMRQFPVDPLGLTATPQDIPGPVMTSLPPPAEPPLPSPETPADEPRLPLGEPDHTGRPLP
ncbi:twin-arginine translocase subunit TatB [Sphingomonas sp. KRR8]|uniref:Sec-independent protein translocase subunit TatA/TatB n=1 Tax=Sphingomonas sp. KRR8 TaxID=2942996 RepID=UPI002020DF2C|nr:twin-arginine translocase subunit TatB [Sphingomonas sp. KRR8]URD59629.1 twin-arginine translocase subunit TatB [Sphingomonas sp. KRR8]